MWLSFKISNQLVRTEQVCLLLVVIIQQINKTTSNDPHETTRWNSSSQQQLARVRLLGLESQVGTGSRFDSLSLRASASTGRQSRSPLGNQFNSMVAPKLIQWSREPVQYYEGSTLVLSCSLSISAGEQAQLKFAWFKNGKQLTTSPTGLSQASNQQRLSIETLTDYSFLRLADLRPADSGGYTCVVSNSLGQEDRTTAQVSVNVKLKWLSDPASQNSSSYVQDDSPHQNRTLLNNEAGHQLIRSRAGQTIVFECNVSGGQVRPRIRWFRLIPTPATSNELPNQIGKPSSQSFKTLSSKSKQLDTSLLDESTIRSTLNQLDQSQANGRDALALRRVELIHDSIHGDHNKANKFHNDTSDANLRWRIETTSNPVGSTKNQLEIYSRLILDRVEPLASGFYECEVVSNSFDQIQNSASSLHHSDNSQHGQDTLHPFVSPQSASTFISSPTSTNRQLQAGDDKLRRLFGLLVHGFSLVGSSWSTRRKDKFLDLFVSIKVKIHLCDTIMVNVLFKLNKISSRATRSS